MERLSRATLEHIFKHELDPYVKQKVLDYYGREHEPETYVKGQAKLYGLNAKTDNKWLFKQMTIHKIAKKISKFEYSIEYDIPMLYSYHADNLEYQQVCLAAAAEFLNERFGTNIYVEELEVYQ